MIAIAGAAGPAIEMARPAAVELEHYEKIEGEALELDGKANKLSQMIRQNLPAAMQGMVVVPLFAGYDLRRHAGRSGSSTSPAAATKRPTSRATGSAGSVRPRVAQEVLDAGREPEEALGMAVEALTDAADEDRAPAGSTIRAASSRSSTLHARAGIERRPRREIGQADLRAIMAARQRPNVSGSGDVMMSMPFYVSPEQVMQDKAEYARKGIARGKSIVTLEFEGGILLMAENPSTSLSKIGEIYDRIAFAGVGKFSEFDQLRKIGVRYADTPGLRLQPRRRARQGAGQRLLAGHRRRLHARDQAPRGRDRRRRGGRSRPSPATRERDLPRASSTAASATTTATA